MITDIEIASKFFNILNVPALTDMITGKVWLLRKPVGRMQEDIVINVLTSTAAANLHLITGIVNINTFTQENTDHTPNGVRIKQLNDVLVSVLGLTNGEAYNGLISYKVQSQKTFRDTDNNALYFSNLRLEFTFKTE